MTTQVKVSANHGWPVLVFQLHPDSNAPLADPVRVAPGTEQTFHVHSGADLRIHEVQPGEDTA